MGHMNAFPATSASVLQMRACRALSASSSLFTRATLSPKRTAYVKQSTARLLLRTRPCRSDASRWAEGASLEQLTACREWAWMVDGNGTAKAAAGPIVISRAMGPPARRIGAPVAQMSSPTRLRSCCVTISGTAAASHVQARSSWRAGVPAAARWLRHPTTGVRRGVPAFFLI